MIEYLRVDAPLLWERPPLDEINVANGRLKFVPKKQGRGFRVEFLPHSPDFLSVVQLPVSYDKTATCPRIERFVQDVFPQSAQAVAWELAGILMVPDTSLQKATLIVGEGGNGKSTYLNLLKAFLNPENVSELSLQRIEAEKFARGRLLGKLVNICGDLPPTQLRESSTFKRITGGDSIEAEYKFGKSFEFVPYARLMFSANSYPKSLDASTAYFDRWAVIPFERRFRDTSQEVKQTTLLASLTLATELSGLLNRAIEGLNFLRMQGNRLTDATAIREAVADFRATTDPLAVWLDHATTTGADAVTLKDELHTAYRRDCDRHGRPVPSKTMLTQSLGKLRPGVQCLQRTVNGKLQPCYVGLQLNGSDHFTAS